MAGSADKILQLQQFDVDPDTPYDIVVGEVMVLMPFFRWATDHWIDATGSYDLCLSADERVMQFINRRSGRDRFAYRYVSLFWLSNRIGVKR